MSDSNNKQPMFNQALVKQMIKSAKMLSLYTLIGIGLLLLVKTLTDAPIQQAQRETLLSTFNEVLPTSFYDNDPLKDTKQVVAPDYLGQMEPVTIYRARKDGQPAGLIISTIAPDGYSGNIELLVGLYADQRIAGVRVLRHKETPGLGDKIEVRKSEWIYGFNGHNLREDNLAIWRVRKDGGHFDEFTGATITPRAIVKSVRKVLEYIKEEGDSLYE